MKKQPQQPEQQCSDRRPRTAGDEMTKEDAENLGCLVAAAPAGWLWFYCWHLWPWSDTEWHWWYLPNAVTFTAVAFIAWVVLSEWFAFGLFKAFGEPK